MFDQLEAQQNSYYFLWKVQQIYVKNDDFLNMPFTFIYNGDLMRQQILLMSEML